MKTLSSWGIGGWGEDRQLIDQTASLLLIYSDRKSINSFSLISPPLLSHCSSLLRATTPSILWSRSSPFFSFCASPMQMGHLWSFKSSVCHDVLGEFKHVCHELFSVVIDCLRFPQCLSTANKIWHLMSAFDGNCFSSLNQLLMFKKCIKRDYLQFFNHSSSSLINTRYILKCTVVILVRYFA